MADKALLVGINAYPDAPLAGCVNDITDMADLLVKEFNFSPSSIRLLADKRATTLGILTRLDWLVSDLNSGDRILFHYSGHGVQVATRNPQEIDGLAECICPVDFDWSETHLIRDQQFHQIFAKVPVGVKCNWISDSCHSADLTKSLLPRGNKSRRYPIPADIAWGHGAAKHKKLIPVGMSNWNSPLNVGFISGCKSNQTSSDAEFHNRPNGALTYFLLQTLKTHKTSTITDVVKMINVDLAKNGYDQQPQAEGLRITSPFLG